MPQLKTSLPSQTLPTPATEPKHHPIHSPNPKSTHIFTTATKPEPNNSEWTPIQIPEQEERVLKVTVLDTWPSLWVATLSIRSLKSTIMTNTRERARQRPHRSGQISSSQTSLITTYSFMHRKEIRAMKCNREIPTA